MESEKKEVVKYDNKFNLTNLNALEQIEMDVFFACISQFTKRKELAIDIPFDELRKLAFLSDKKYDQGKSRKKFKSLAQKVINMQFWIEDEESFTAMPLFVKFKANFVKENMNIEMNPKFARYFFDIPEKIGFTRFELEPFIFLRSKYSKTLFRYLLQNFTGKWTVDFKEFRELIGFPDSYNNSVIKLAINRSIPELVETGYFSHIEYDLTYAKRQGRPIKDIVFNYKINRYKALERAGQTTLGDYDYSIQTEPKTQLEVDTSDPLRPVAVKKTVEIERKCPKCTKGNVLRRQAQKEGENFGKWYEKCEFNTPNTINRCHYYRWLDEDETKKAESERITIIE